MKHTLAILISALFVFAPSLAEAGTRSFTKVADTDTTIPGGAGSFTTFDVPSLDGGYVAFKGQGSDSQDGVYTYIGTSLAKVADTSTAIPSGSGNFTDFYALSLYGGNVAFNGVGSFQDGIYTHIGASLAKVADTNTAIPGATGNFTTFYDPSLDGENVAFNGTDGDTQDGIYTNISGSLAMVADTGTTMPGQTENFVIFYGTSFDAGAVAFAGEGSTVGGVYKTVGSTLTKVADTDTTMPGQTENFSILYTPSLDAGNVVFAGEGSTVAGVYKTVESILTKVADTDTAIPDGMGNFIDFSSDDDYYLNYANWSLDNGNVAFWAEGYSQQQGIYTDLGGTLEKVIDLTDLLDGKIIDSLAIGKEGLSGNSIAFTAYFSDGSSAVYVATPEPASALLFVLGLGLLVSRKRR